MADCNLIFSRGSIRGTNLHITTATPLATKITNSTNTDTQLDTNQQEPYRDADVYYLEHSYYNINQMRSNVTYRVSSIRMRPQIERA